jgi:hypothetical protein
MLTLSPRNRPKRCAEFQLFWPNRRLLQRHVCRQRDVLRLVYPYCDERLRDWIFHHVPDDLLIGPGGVNKVLMRKYIDQHFQQLPYVKVKGSFRFDLCGLARTARFDQVHAFALQTQALLARCAALAGDSSKPLG